MDFVTISKPFVKLNCHQTALVLCNYAKGKLLFQANVRLRFMLFNCLLVKEGYQDVLEKTNQIMVLHPLIHQSQKTTWPWVKLKKNMKLCGTHRQMHHSVW